MAQGSEQLNGTTKRHMLVVFQFFEASRHPGTKRNNNRRDAGCVRKVAQQL